MPKNFVELAVLISCPSEVNEERQIVRAAIEEVSELLKKTNGVALHPVSWESDLLPGVGNDAQSVINSQVDGRYDIYLGLLGTRFGTQTPRAGSGTEEEFLRALETYQVDPSKMRVLFYFKNSTENLHHLDLEQFKKVIEFRKRISETTLYYEFSDGDALLKMLKVHLQNLVIEQWVGGKWKVLTPMSEVSKGESRPSLTPQHKATEGTPEPQTAERDDDEDEEQDGAIAILDVMASAENGLEIAKSALDSMTVLANDLTNSLNKRTASMPPSPNARQLKTIADCTADDLDSYAEGLKKQIPIFKSNLRDALEDFETAVDLYVSQKLGEESAVANIPQNMTTLASGMRDARGNLDIFRKMLDAAPGFTAKFKRSRRIVKRLLDDMSATIVVFSDKAQSIGAKFSK